MPGFSLAIAVSVIKFSFFKTNKMKKIFYSISAVALIIISCNNKPGNEKNAPVTKADTGNIVIADTSAMTVVTHSFNDVNPNLAASLRVVIDRYLDIKNALANNDGSAAAGSGKAMGEAMSKIDKSLFTTEQKKIYDDIEDDLQENAEHIGKNAGDIGHQREHFSMMSEDIYDLVKAFGGGKPLYIDQCPMANDGKGGIWLTDAKSISNPYFGGKMNECVKIREVIK